MALHSVGLKTQIWNNNFKSIVLLSLYPFLIGLIVWFGAAAWAMIFQSQTGAQEISAYETINQANALMGAYWYYVFGFVGIWFVVAFFSHAALINKMSGAHSVSRAEEPELYNLLENLCIAQGISMPHLNIIETHARNAFASGIGPKSYAITVTRGLMNSLQKDELEAVLGHELAHILNHDVRLLMVTVIFTGMVGFFSQMAWSSMRRNIFYGGGRGKDRGKAMMFMFAVAIILWIGYLATLLMRFALSRRREFMADAGAVEMTKNPQAMMRALMRIAGRDHVPAMPGDVAQMCIENSKPLMGAFSTHPPIDARISTISIMTGEPIPDLPHAGPADKSDRLDTQRDPRNPWITRRRGQRKKTL